LRTPLKVPAALVASFRERNPFNQALLASAGAAPPTTAPA
jgi:hypothetical protein